jgi:hypothetical protein
MPSVLPSVATHVKLRLGKPELLDVRAGVPLERLGAAHKLAQRRHKGWNICGVRHVRLTCDQRVAVGEVLKGRSRIGSY